MSKHSIIRILLIVIVVALNFICISDGIKYGSFAGIIMALGSLTALVFCLHLLKKLREIPEEE
ncbi:MAG: hypothetical protein C0459_09240 [Chitinophaga sp.]|jgi:threonine/homoserine/homoserine lactone efflux protein|nr:hypothetical protein [Chitinophaga sp.]